MNIKKFTFRYTALIVGILGFSNITIQANAAENFRYQYISGEQLSRDAQPISPYGSSVLGFRALNDAGLVSLNIPINAEPVFGYHAVTTVGTYNYKTNEKIARPLGAKIDGSGFNSNGYTENRSFGIINNKGTIAGRVVTRNFVTGVDNEQLALFHKDWVEFIQTSTTPAYFDKIYDLNDNNTAFGLSAGRGPAESDYLFLYQNKKLTKLNVSNLPLGIPIVNGQQN